MTATETKTEIKQISIHALLAESDFNTTRVGISGTLFLSTFSLRRATVVDVRRATGTAISIHALLAESDVAEDLKATIQSIFLSTLSLRRATQLILIFPIYNQFLSTLSLRRATLPV